MDQELREFLLGFLQERLPGAGAGTYLDTWLGVVGAVESLYGAEYARGWANGTARGREGSATYGRVKAPREPDGVIWSAAKKVGWVPDKRARAGAWERGVVRGVAAAAPGEPMEVDLPCAEPDGGGMSMGRLMGEPVWFGCVGKKLVYRRWRDRMCCWKQSLTPPAGDIRKVRLGGSHRDEYKNGRSQWVQVLRHGSYEEVSGVLGQIRDGVGGWESGGVAEGEYAPAMSLAGDDTWGFPLCVGMVDVDYKPGEDRDGTGRRMRNQLARLWRDAGYGLSRSQSGKSFHCWFRLDRRVGYRAVSCQAALGNGLGIEIYLAGAKRLIAARPGNMEGAGEWGVMPFGYINGLMVMAKAKELRWGDMLTLGDFRREE